MLGLRGYLALVDIDRTQSFIFATDRLREIAGASFLLDEINRKQIGDLFASDSQAGDQLLVNGGGLTKAIFADAGKAEQFARQAAALYHQKTSLATATWCVQEIHGDFRSAHQQVEQRIKALKAAKGLDAATGKFNSSNLVSSSFLKRCDVCGLQPAIVKNPFPNHTEYTCAACNAKSQARTKDVAPLDGEGIHREIQKALGLFRNKDGTLQKVEDIIPDDFGQVTIKQGPMKEKSFIGLILADGNSIGDHIKTRLDTPEKLKAFSGSFERLIRKSLLEALIECYKSYQWVARRGMNKLPVRVLLLGGDDLLVVAPGELVLPLARWICEKFQKLSLADEFRGPLHLSAGRPLTLSAGVAIGKVKHPFFDFIHLAEGLLESAKEKGRMASQNGSPVSVLDFSAIRWSGRISLGHFRERRLQFQNSSGNFRLTGKPFTLDGFNGLVKDIELIRASVPRFKYKAFNALCDPAKSIGEMEADLNGWAKAVFGGSALLTSLPGLFPDSNMWTHNQKEDRFETRILDGLELIDFWPKKDI